MKMQAFRMHMVVMIACYQFYGNQAILLSADAPVTHGLVNLSNTNSMQTSCSC